MRLRLLLDEDTERELAEKLRHSSHSVERVVEADELGAGATDDAVRAYARRTNRRRITHDDDHIAVPPEEHAGVFYCPNQRIDPFTIFRIIQQVTASYSSHDELPSVVYLTDEWLDRE